MGMLWPNFMATFGDVFGLAFAIEGISFFVEAIFIGIYVYGWNRLSPRAHLLAGIPIILSGFSGSLMVIAVNGWMNHPTRLHAEGRPRRRRAPVRGAVREQLLLARAHPHVHRGLHGRRLPDRRRLRVGRAAGTEHALQPRGADRAAHGRRARVARADRRRRLGGARRRRESAGQAGGARGRRDDAERALPSTSSGGTTATASSTASGSRSCSRCSPSTTRTPR